MIFALGFSAPRLRMNAQPRITFRFPSSAQIMRHGVGEPKRNEIHCALLLPMWQAIRSKANIRVRIEKAQLRHEGQVVLQGGAVSAPCEAADWRPPLLNPPRFGKRRSLFTFPSMQLESARLLQRLKPLFQENFEKFGELGAAVSVWQNGKPIVDLYGGFRDAHRENPWTSDTLVLVWSATKGNGSACVLHVLQGHGINLDERVAEFWPEFTQAGKQEITLAQLLSHQAGLCALDRRVDVLDYDAVIQALETQKPLWALGTAHGYHARTFGFLLDELVRRITGKTLSEYWRENFARPLQLDFWIGLPEQENPRVATIYA